MDNTNNQELHRSSSKNVLAITTAFVLFFLVATSLFLWQKNQTDNLRQEVYSVKKQNNDLINEIKNTKEFSSKSETTDNLFNISTSTKKSKDQAVSTETYTQNSITDKKIISEQNQNYLTKDDLTKKLPSYFILSDIEYFDNFDAAPQKAVEAKPCNDKNLDPSYSPYCFTKLTILEQEKTNNLGEYIKANDIISGYESRTGNKLVKGTNQENIPYVYTPTAFMCIGTGGESCMRKRFVYHLNDGQNILAEISFWPFKDGEYTGSLDKKVQDVINIYENILIK